MVALAAGRMIRRRSPVALAAAVTVTEANRGRVRVMDIASGTYSPVQQEAQVMAVMTGRSYANVPVTTAGAPPTLSSSGKPPPLPSGTWHDSS